MPKTKKKTRTQRQKLSRRLLPALAIIITGGIGVYLILSSMASDRGTADINQVVVQLSQEERVIGPTQLTDNGFFVEQNANNKRKGYVSNQDTYRFDLGDKTDLPNVPTSQSKLKKHVILKRDARPKQGTSERKKFDQDELRGLHPDRCGAWVLSAIYDDPLKKDPQHKVGWYHAEDRCNYDIGETHMTTSFMKSTDGGKTWKKPKYPHNQILTADRSLQGDPRTDDTANGRIILQNGYYYMIYGAFASEDSNLQVHLARSKQTEGGRPGTWWKWYCNDEGACDFDNAKNWKQPGIGGKTTAIKNIASSMRFASFNRYLKRYIAFQAHGNGFQMSASVGKDLTKWQRKTEILYPAVTDSSDYTVNNWNYGGDSKQCKNKQGVVKPYPCKQLYAYTSIVGLKGDGEATGQEFYLYYVKRYPGENFDQRYLLRRKVTFIYPTDRPAPQSSRVELVMYQNNEGHTRITTELPEYKLGYKVKRSIGYLRTTPTDGYDPLFECVTSTGRYYTVRYRVIAPYDVPAKPSSADIPPTKCRGGDTLIRRIGWAAREPIAGTATIQIPLTNGTPTSVKDRFMENGVVGYALRSL